GPPRSSKDTAPRTSTPRAACPGGRTRPPWPPSSLPSSPLASPLSCRPADDWTDPAGWGCSRIAIAVQCPPSPSPGAEGGGDASEVPGSGRLRRARRSEGLLRGLRRRRAHHPAPADVVDHPIAFLEDADPLPLPALPRR